MIFIKVLSLSRVTNVFLFFYKIKYTDHSFNMQRYFQHRQTLKLILFTYSQSKLIWVYILRVSQANQ